MITITIRTDNAAFGDLPRERCQEIARILHELSVEIAGGVMPTSLRDINGNRVGTVTDSSAEDDRRSMIESARRNGYIR